jgi:hypothetical protein
MGQQFVGSEWQIRFFSPSRTSQTERGSFVGSYSKVASCQLCRKPSPVHPTNVNWFGYHNQCRAGTRLEPWYIDWYPSRYQTTDHPSSSYDLSQYQPTCTDYQVGPCLSSCLVVTWGNTYLILGLYQSQYQVQFVTYLPAKKSALDSHTNQDQAGVKAFKKIWYQYQLVCSKVDTRPALITTMDHCNLPWSIQCPNPKANCNIWKEREREKKKDLWSKSLVIILLLWHLTSSPIIFSGQQSYWAFGLIQSVF